MTSTIMMILFLVLVATLPVLFIGYPPGSDRRGVAGRSSRGFFDPVSAFFAEAELRDAPDHRGGAPERRRS